MKNYHCRNTQMLLLDCIENVAMLLCLFKVIFSSEMHWRYSMQTTPLPPPSLEFVELPFIFKKVQSLVHKKKKRRYSSRASKTCPNPALEPKQKETLLQTISNALMSVHSQNSPIAFFQNTWKEMIRNHQTLGTFFFLLQKLQSHGTPNSVTKPSP